MEDVWCAGESACNYLRIEKLAKCYAYPLGGGDNVPVLMPTLENIGFTVDRGEFVSIIGPSGCGKSTLFNIISGLEKPDEGRIILEGRDITGERGHVSYMLQKDLLLPWRSVLDNCILGMELQNTDRTQARWKARELLSEFNLDDFADSYPQRLSGGMRQRVAFARTMLAGRELLLLDEPFGALDAYTKSEMHGWLAEICLKFKPTVLFITHDVEEALFLSDRVYVLSARPGSIKLEISVPFERPRTRDLLIRDGFIGLKKNILEILFTDS